jgi:2-methylcitrate dehydratase PrpD
MSHAEAVHTLQPAAGATDQIVQFTTGVHYDALPEDARHYARRHLLDTVGVMIAGAGGTMAKSRSRAGRGARISLTPRSSAAPRRTASSSTTATGTARRIAAA